MVWIHMGIHPSALTQRRPSVPGVILGVNIYLVPLEMSTDWELCWFVCLHHPQWLQREMGYCLVLKLFVAVRVGILLILLMTRLSSLILLSEVISSSSNLFYLEVIDGSSNYNMCEDAFSHPQCLKPTHSRVFQDFTSCLLRVVRKRGMKDQTYKWSKR